jgi:hypothetical protein
MRTQEILEALGREFPGIEIWVGKERSTLSILYRPYLTGVGSSIYAAATDVAARLVEHKECPEAVKLALVEFNWHTEFLQL